MNITPEVLSNMHLCLSSKAQHLLYEAWYIYGEGKMGTAGCFSIRSFPGIDLGLPKRQIVQGLMAMGLLTVWNLNPIEREGEAVIHNYAFTKLGYEYTRGLVKTMNETTTE